MAYELIEDLSRQSVVYAEVRYSPLGGLAWGLTGDDYVLGAMEGLERGERDFGVKARSILAFKRDQPGSLSMSATKVM